MAMLMAMLCAWPFGFQLTVRDGGGRAIAAGATQPGEPPRRPAQSEFSGVGSVREPRSTRLPTYPDEICPLKWALDKETLVDPQTPSVCA